MARDQPDRRADTTKAVAGGGAGDGEVDRGDGAVTAGDPVDQPQTRSRRKAAKRNRARGSGTSVEEREGSGTAGELDAGGASDARSRRTANPEQFQEYVGTERPPSPASDPGEDDGGSEKG